LKTQVDQSERNKNNGAAGIYKQQHNIISPIVVSQREEVLTQRKVLELARAGLSTQRLNAIQRIAKNSPIARQLRNLQELANNAQRKVNPLGIDGRGDFIYHL
jgi:hypothetical protein